MAEFRQTSFGSGELSPTMWGRTDLAQYEHGLRRCYNFVVTRHGAATFRPGLRYIGELPAGNQVRMFPLTVSTEESYILVFGPNYVRIYRSFTPGNPQFTELSTPYTSEQISKLKFQQLGRGVLVLCPGVQPREIRGSGATWEITEFTADPKIIGASVGLEVIWGYQGSAGEGESMRAADGSYRPARPPDKKYRYAFAYSVVYYHPASGTYVETTPDNIVIHGDPYGSPYAAQRNENGELIWPVGNPWMEAGLLPFERIDPDNYPIRQVYLVRNPNYSPPTGYEHHSIRIYRGSVGIYESSLPGFRDGSVWGLVAESIQNPALQDVVIEWNYFAEPDYAQPPRYQLSDLNDYRGTLVVVRHRPTVAALHDQRLVLAASQEAPGKIWLSQVNSFDNFDLYPLPAAHHALTLELASPYMEEIRALVSHHSLLVFTDRNVWAIDGADRGPIAVGNAVARIHAKVGSSHIPPLVLGSDVLFTGPLADRIYRLLYDGRSHTYYVEDVSIFSNHLVQGSVSSRVRAWTATSDVTSTVWIAREDGKFLSYTYAPDSGVFAFAQHETGPGDAVIDFCTIHTVSGDVTYALVRRSNRIYLEQMDDAFHLDSYVSSIRSIPSGRHDIVSGLDHLNGREVMVVAYAGLDSTRKVALGPFTVSSGSVSFELPTLPGEGPLTTYYTVAVGLPYVGELELLDFPVEKLRVKTISKVGWEVVGSRGLFTGEDFDNLYEWTQTTIADVYGPAPTSGLVEVVIGSTWNKHGRAVLRQSLPLPLTVLGVTREGILGGN